MLSLVIRLDFDGRVAAGFVCSLAGVLARLVAAAEETGSCDEQTGRGQKEEKTEGREDSDDLSPMPQDRSPRVAELAFARSTVIVTQQKIVL